MTRAGWQREAERQQALVSALLAREGEALHAPCVAPDGEDLPVGTCEIEQPVHREWRAFQGHLSRQIHRPGEAQPADVCGRDLREAAVAAFVRSATGRVPVRLGPNLGMVLGETRRKITESKDDGAGRRQPTPAQWHPGTPSFELLPARC